MMYCFKCIFILVPFCLCLITNSINSAEVDELMKSTPEGNVDSVGQSKISNGKKYMIVTADKRASIAAQNILDRGGSAIDAIIAAQMVLNVVEPQSSGIGGGGFLLYYDFKEKKITAFDGRERAPIKFNPNVFLKINGKKKGFIETLAGGLAVGAPSLVSMLEKAHKQYGILDWTQLFDESINYSNNGFVIGERLAKLIKKAPHLKNQSASKKYFNIENGGLIPGKKLVNKELADSLRIIRKKGSSGLLEGIIAKSILIAVNDSDNIGLLVNEDFSLVRPKAVHPVCADYRGWKICGMGPPSSGGITVLQILGILSNFNLNSGSIKNVEVWHLFLEASKIAYADRDYYIADDKFVKVPISEMLDKTYLKLRANQVNDRAINQPVKPGNFNNKNAYKMGKDMTSELNSTTHISIIDQFGNAASLTSSIEFMFGSGLMVSGFLLNNQMTDFSFYPFDGEGHPIANRPEARKKPRSSMSPTLVFDSSGSLRLVIGSPGGSRIICYVAVSLVRFIDLNMSIKDIVKSPNICNRGSYSAVETGSKGDEITKDLEKLGYKIERKKMVSGLHIVYRDENGILWGTADPRREGTAVGK